MAYPKRRLILGAGLAAPLAFTRRGWAQSRSINVGTYTGPQGEFVRRQVIPKFQTDYGCRVFQTEGVTLGQIAMLRMQKANPTYTVMFMDDAGVPVAKNEGLIEPLPADKIPNMANVIPRFRLNDGFAVAFALSIVAPYYNTELVHGIGSWAELWDPVHKGRVMLITPKQTQNVQLVVAAAGLATGKPFREAQYLLDDAWAKMAALKPNVQTVFDNNVNAVLQVMQGQADIAGPDNSKTVLPYAAKRPLVAMSTPKEGVFGGVNTVTMVRGGPEPDLGAAFIDRIFDPAVQKAMAEYTFAAPTVRGITLNAETAKLAAYPESRMDELGMVTVDWAAINPRRGAIVEKFNQVFEG